jgi:hypothetical protein
MVAWEFALPTATAVLTLLYPNYFTVYDVLVCRELQWEYHPDRYFSAKLWSDYQAYTQAVIKAAPANLSLRDKDRYLIGRAYRKAVETDCRG